MVNYELSAKETTAQTKAWRTGALKSVLTLLIKEYGRKKVEEELRNLKKINNLF